MTRALSTRSTLLLALAALALACRGGSKPGEQSSAAAPLPPPQAMRVQPDEVACEGRWFPLEAGPEAPALANPVRLVCKRAAGSCLEKLTRPSKYPGGEPVQDDFMYRIAEWTKWGQPAGRLVAARREGTATVEIRLSLSGLAGEKSFLDKGAEVRWRLE
jgi:hypothetical protein